MIAALRRIGASSAVPPDLDLYAVECGGARERINSACVDLLVKACIEECPVDCIHEGNRVMYLP